jgi:transposase
MPSLADLLQLPSGYCILDLSLTTSTLQVTLASTATTALCPRCHTPSTSQHSAYTRTLRDLAWGQRSIHLLVHTHKWRCRVASCLQRVFAERMDPLAYHSARMTTRLRSFFTTLTVATSGEAASRLAGTWHMPVAPSTLLASVMRLPPVDHAPPEEIGLDEFTYRRWRVFGTIIIDLQRHCILDLLPDREPDTVATWLKRHPTVRVIIRDRAEAFATAIALGAPQALQVLERFHLLRNLVDTLPAILGRCLAELRQAPADTPMPPPQPAASAPPPIPEGPWQPLPDTQQSLLRQVARHAERTERYEQLRMMRDAGMKSEDIGQALRISPRTVRYQLQHYRPDSQRRKRRTAFDPYADYVRQRWEAGCRNGRLLWQEIAEQGYPGTLRTLYRYLVTLRPERPPRRTRRRRPAVAPPPTIHAPSAEQRSRLRRYTLTQLQWFIVAWSETLTVDQRDHLTWLCESHSALAVAIDLVRQFRHLIHQSTKQDLDDWATRCESSPVPELVRFVRGLRAEWPHVVAGFTHQASNGQTEGQVNKLKAIKRQIYGRAGFPLLRQRILHAR